MNKLEIIFGLVKEFWGGIVAVGVAVGAVYGWREKRAKSSTEMLFNELERLKQKVILQVTKEIDQATEIAEKNRIIEDLKVHCPDCYDTVMLKYKPKE